MLSVTLLLTLLVVAAATFASAQCPIGTTTCVGPASAGGDVCCDNSTSPHREACCPDPKNGGVCCVSELTFCCAPQAAFDHPSRCCPRWSVCCEFGRYGCCDPDTKQPLEHPEQLMSNNHNNNNNKNEGRKKQKPLQQLSENNEKSKKIARRSNNVANFTSFTASALMTEPDWLSGAELMYAAQIDTATGKYTQQQATRSEQKHYDPVGESPRSFMFRASTNEFFLLQANFTANPSPGDDPKRQIVLYTINGVTGVTTSQVVSGAVDEVTGFQYVPAKQVIVFSTLMYSDEKKEAAIGFNFYTLDIESASAKLISQSVRGPSVGNWDGWFHAVSDDLKYVYRLGYQHVRTSVNFGLEITDISARTATTSFTFNIAVPAGHDIFRSLTLVPGSTPNAAAIKQRHGFRADDAVFISLANNATTQSLDAFMWGLADPTKYTQIGTFENAHRQHYFGPIEEAVSDDGTKYTALVCWNSIFGPNGNEVEIIAIDLTTGATSAQQLTPALLSTTVSYAGIGIAKEN